ncbi:TRAP transporter large permease subunit [Vreelandella neptunia]
MNVLMDTVRTTAMLFAVVLTALIFANFINLAGLPDDLLALVNGLNVAPFVVIVVIIVIYVVLGCVFESMSMLLLTMPIFFPWWPGWATPSVVRYSGGHRDREWPDYAS